MGSGSANSSSVFELVLLLVTQFPDSSQQFSRTLGKRKQMVISPEKPHFIGSYLETPGFS